MYYDCWCFVSICWAFSKSKIFACLHFSLNYLTTLHFFFIIEMIKEMNQIQEGTLHGPSWTCLSCLVAMNGATAYTMWIGMTRIWRDTLSSLRIGIHGSWREEVCHQWMKLSNLRKIYQVFLMVNTFSRLIIKMYVN